MTPDERIKELEAEVARLQGYIDDNATGVHSCHDGCQRVECVLRRKLELVKKVLPFPDTQGVRFGKWSWISWDKLVGWDGEDETARLEYYQRIFPKGIMEWREDLHKAVEAIK